MELNTRFSGGYKRYNESIPKYLQDKPRQFLKPCLERITTAKDIRPQFIKEGEKRGEFVIQSTQTKNTRYNLSFGGTDHDGMPRCSCPDFSCTGFLCKHFFAVFEHRDDWKWDALPKSYRENPYLCLDEKGLSSNPISIDETSPDPDYWLNCNIDDETTITLYAESKKRILQFNFWLADSEIHAGRKLLKKQHPFITGFHSPSIRGNSITPEPSEFIQIINTGVSHWVCLSTIGCPSGTVKKLYNSIRSSCPNKVLLAHASRMLFTKEQSITFVIPPVQEQIGPNDRGIFALAFATSLCRGMPPEEREYDQGLMRWHYVECLEQLATKPFPGHQRLLPPNGKMLVYEVKVFCSCRMPEDGKK